MNTLAYKCIRLQQETEHLKHMYGTVIIREIGKGKADTGVKVEDK